MNKKLLALLGGVLVLGAGATIAQTIVIPQVQQINNGDLFQDVVNGAPQAQSQYASALLLAGYNGSLPARANALIGGDATTNLFQRATTGSSVTTTVTYGGPDRWAYWSGTATAMTVSQDSTAADLPTTGYQYAFKMARTSGQTGVVQVCTAQEVESANSYQFQGTTAELDFHATAGANFSAASSNVTAYIVTGTGTDEGMQKLAWGLNAGGGGSTGWTGQANATAAVIPISTASGRYAAVASIPATATEIGVALCFTPVGTAGTNDYVALAGIQLVRNQSLTANATVGFNCTAINCTSFDRTRQLAQESLLQYRYYYQIKEAAAIVPRASCRDISTTQGDCLIQFPVAMRAAPTMSYTAGFALPTTAGGGTLGNCSALATSTVVASTAAGTQNAIVSCTASTVPAAGTVDILYDNNGAGFIKANAEL